MENFKCPVCKQDKVSKIIPRQVGGQVAKCASCGHLTLWPPYNEELILAQYNNSTCTSSKDKGRAILDNMALKLLKSKDKRENLTVLDVGCGLGEFMKECSKGKYDVQGLEITKDIVEQLKSEGFNVHMKNLAEFAETGQRFDWVVCLNLIEHLSDPLAGIEQLASLVKDKGMLVIETPNGDAIEQYGKNAYGLHIDKEHLNYFKPNQLISLLKERNFSLVCKKYYPLGAKMGRAKVSGDFKATQEMNLEQTYRTNNVSKSRLRTLLDKMPPSLRGCLRSIIQSTRYILSLDEILSGKAFEYIIIMKRN